MTKINEKSFHFDAKEIGRFTEEAVMRVAFKQAFPQWTEDAGDVTRLKLGPRGGYKTFAMATRHDVTLIGWMHRDGSVTVKYVCW